MRTTNVFERNTAEFNRGSSRFIINKGGTRSGKTVAVLQLLILVARSDKTPTINSVVSETLPHLRLGAVRDFKQIMIEDDLFDEKRWNNTNYFYTFENGSIIEFFSSENTSKVHGPARDRLFINEAQNIKYEIGRQLFVRTRGQIFIDYNPTHEFWVETKLIGEGRETLIKSTYKDNPFLSAEQVQEIESYKTDKNWWRIYGEGETGRLEGLVFDFEQVEEMPDGQYFYGLDFGFTNDPTAIIRILIRDDVLYLDEICYQTKLLNSDICDILSSENIRKHSDEIFADSAEPKSIEEIYRAGFNVKPAPKGQDSIVAGIQKMQQYRIKVTKRSVNLIREFRNYSWKIDKNGNPLNVPIDAFNHAIDASRYGVFSRTTKHKAQGTQSATFKAAKKR